MSRNTFLKSYFIIFDFPGSVACGHSLVVVHGLFIKVASLLALGLSSAACGILPGIELLSLALQEALVVLLIVMI